MRNPIGEDLGGVQESGRTHLARPQPAVGGGSLHAFRQARPQTEAGQGVKLTCVKSKMTMIFHVGIDVCIYACICM